MNVNFNIYNKRPFLRIKTHNLSLNIKQLNIIHELLPNQSN